MYCWSNIINKVVKMNENKKIKNRYNKSVENKISFISEITKKTL